MVASNGVRMDLLYVSLSRSQALTGEGIGSVLISDCTACTICSVLREDEVEEEDCCLRMPAGCGQAAHGTPAKDAGVHTPLGPTPLAHSKKGFVELPGLHAAPANAAESPKNRTPPMT